MKASKTKMAFQKLAKTTTKKMIAPVKIGPTIGKKSNMPAKIAKARGYLMSKIKKEM